VRLTARDRHFKIKSGILREKIPLTSVDQTKPIAKAARYGVKAVFNDRELKYEAER
jgi:hypothetical protein